MTFVKPFGQLRNPLHGINSKAVFHTFPVTIRPMGRHTGFGNFVHLAGTDLHLDALAITARNRGMDRAITVRFRLADIVLKATGNSAPSLMNCPKHAVAIGLCRSQNPETIDVGQAAKAKVLFLHLTPDRIGLFRATNDLCRQTRFFQLDAHIGRNLFDHIACLALQHDKAAHDRIARLGIQNAKGQIFQLFTHPLHTHATRKRRIDIHGFAGLLDLLVRAHGFDCAHVVQTVGQLHQGDAQIAAGRHKQLAEILGLLCLGTRELQVSELGHTIHQLGNLATKPLRDIRK